MSISGVYGTLMSTWIYGLQAGGAAAIMWSWILGGAGAWALAFSIAEIASAYPSSGAMYFTLKYLAPEEQVPILCWIAGVSTPFPTNYNQTTNAAVHHRVRKPSRNSHRKRSNGIRV